MSANLCECDHEGYFHKPSCRVAGCKCLAFTPAPQAQPDASEGAKCASCGEAKPAPFNSDIGPVCLDCVEAENAALHHQIGAQIKTNAAQAQEIARLKGEAQHHRTEAGTLMVMCEQRSGTIEALRAQLAAAEKRAVEAEAKAEQMKEALHSARNLAANALSTDQPKSFLPELIQKANQALALTPSQAMRAVKLEVAEKAYEEGWQKRDDYPREFANPSLETDWLASETRRALEVGK